MVSCPECHWQIERYTLPDGKVEVRCPHCGYKEKDIKPPEYDSAEEYRDWGNHNG